MTWFKRLWFGFIDAEYCYKHDINKYATGQDGTRWLCGLCRLEHSEKEKAKREACITRRESRRRALGLETFSGSPSEAQVVESGCFRPSQFERMFDA
jgi:hypothetical protein